jgi:hypothetical protein
MRNVSDKCCTENENTRFMLHKFFKESSGLIDNVENNVEPVRPQCGLRAG